MASWRPAVDLEAAASAADEAQFDGRFFIGEMTIDPWENMEKCGKIWETLEKLWKT